MLFGGTGFFIDSFTCRQGEGIVWLHGYGNAFEVTLAHGESIDIEPGGWLHKDPSVRMETIIQRVTAGFLAGSGQLFWNRFTGQGPVGLQSVYLHFPTKE
jgi:uncharacterized protein (AIM24 family)